MEALRLSAVRSPAEGGGVGRLLQRQWPDDRSNAAVDLGGLVGQRPAPIAAVQADFHCDHVALRQRVAGPAAKPVDHRPAALVGHLGQVRVQVLPA